MRVLLVLAATVPLVLCDCQSFGIDFQSGGSYFQNSLSNDPFTALQKFEGCQNDTSHNVIIDPAGDQTECTETPLVPDDTPQQIICPQWPKNKLSDGAWSLLIISNNGPGDPIAYQRDFNLTVGPQQTITAPVPTISGGAAGTLTITPLPSTSVVTVGFIQYTSSRTSIVSTSTTVVVAASCSTSTSGFLDPIATIIPSILGQLNLVAADVVQSGSAAKRAVPTDVVLSARFKRAIIEGRLPGDDLKAAFLRAREAGLAHLMKRAPDQRTITSTPSPVYVPATITAPPRTATTTSYVFYYVTTLTTTITSTSTSIIKTTPAGAAVSCSNAGGTLV